MGFLAYRSLWALVHLVSLFDITAAYPNLVEDIRSRQINVGDVAASYDYIVVGGGQSGLVIANRLSEDASSLSLSSSLLTCAFSPQERNLTD